MIRQFDYTVTAIYTFNGGGKYRRIATVRASSEERAEKALKDKIIRDKCLWSTDRIEFLNVTATL